MINDLEEVQWAYLLDPTFQQVNSSGKPLTGGWLEVYIHGTRTKYYCASDFDGTLHPFKIPLDSLGSNIVLASPAHAYDVYVYNVYGNLVMSRYNVVPSTGDGTVIKDVVNITSNDGTVNVQSSDQTNWDLSIQDTVDRVEQNEQDISDIKGDIEDIQEDISGKKDKQTALTFNGAATKTVKKITQNANGEMNVEFEDIDLPPEVPNVEITSEDNSVQVTETTDVQTNTKTFDLSVNVDDALEYGQFRATNVTTQAQLAKIKGNLELDNYSIKLKKGNSYHFTVRGSYVPDSAANTATTISYIEYSSFTPIQVNVDNTITGPQYFEISYDVYNFSQNGNYNVSFASITGGKVTELWVEVHNLNGVTINGSGVSNIVIAREYNGVLDDTYDGLKIRQADNGNEIVALRKNNSWFSLGQLAPLSAGADKILITDANGTVHWGIVGNGLEIDNDTLEVKIDSEVGDVVETVNKLSKDIDSKLTTNFDMAQIIAKYDFADSSVTGLSNGATMLYQAFTIPINNNIRIISAEEEEPTLLGIYATQNYTGKIMLAIYQYDFESGYTQYIGDTGPVTVNAGRNEYPLRHINPDITELSSGNVYYAALYLPSSHNNGLNLVGCPGYSQTFNSIPRLTMGTQNILYNNTEIDMTDATTGRLDYNDGNNNYYIGPWLDGYNESNYACPRFFLQLRNGTFNEPIIVNVPFIDIGAYTLDYQNGIPDVFGDTSTLSQSSDAYPIFQTVVPLQDVDITEITLIDGNATHNAVYWNTGAFGIHSSDFSTRIGNGVTATVTDDTIATSVYSHKYTLSAPIHLTANTTYRFPSGYVTNLVSRVRQYATPTVEKTLFLMDNIYYVSEYSNYVRANAVQGTFLKVKDSNNNEYVI